MAGVHPTAIVGSGAELGHSVSIGPYCVIGDGVRIADDVVLDPHVVIAGNTAIGARTRIAPFAAIGGPPQDLSYRGEPNGVLIGADTVVREHVTIHAGTSRGRGMTEIGDRCLLMAASHVGHDCKLGNGVIVSNNVMLGGHTVLGDHVNIGGGAAIRQRLRIGRLAFISGISGVSKDVLPFGYVIGYRGRLDGINLVGLKRSGFPRERIRALQACFRILFAEEDTFRDRLARLRTDPGDDPAVAEVLAFIESGGGRPLLTPFEQRDD